MTNNEYVDALVQYDVLDNERRLAVRELRKMPDWYPHDGKRSPAGKFNEALSDAIGVTGLPSFAKIRDRLIHLLGGDAPTLSDLDGIWQDGAESENNGGESASKMTKIAEIGKLGVDVTSPNDDGTCPNDVPTPSITDELREWMRVVLTDDDQAYAIADRIDAQFNRCCEMWERTATDTAQEVHDSMEAECGSLARERDYWKQNCNAVLWLLGDVAIAWRNKQKRQVKHESGCEVKESEYREYDHTAPVVGVPTVFANVEYPRDEPPEVIEIAGTRYIREDARERD